LGSGKDVREGVGAEGPVEDLLQFAGVEREHPGAMRFRQRSESPLEGPDDHLPASFLTAFLTTFLTAFLDRRLPRGLELPAEVAELFAMRVHVRLQRTGPLIPEGPLHHPPI